MFFKGKKEKKLKSVLSVLVVLAAQDGNTSEDEGHAIGSLIVDYAKKLGISAKESFIHEVLNYNTDELAAAQLEILKWSHEEKIEVLNLMFSLSVADGDLSMPELFSIAMWSKIWGGLNEDEIIKHILTHEDIVNKFGDLREEFEQYVLRVNEIGVNEARDEYILDRSEVSNNQKSSSKDHDSDKKYCSECGKEVNQKAKFCAHCGNKQ